MKRLLLASLFFITPALAGQLYWTQPFARHPSIVISTITIKKSGKDVTYVTRVFDMNIRWQTLWKSYSENLYRAQLQHQIATHWAAVNFQEPLKRYSHEAHEDDFKWECSSQ